MCTREEEGWWTPNGSQEFRLKTNVLFTRLFLNREKEENVRATHAAAPAPAAPAGSTTTTTTPAAPQFPSSISPLDLSEKLWPLCLNSALTTSANDLIHHHRKSDLKKKSGRRRRSLQGDTRE
jgi:hypothetical protein